MSNETELTRMADELIALRQDNIGLRLALRTKQDSIDAWITSATNWRLAWEDLHARIRALTAATALVAEVRQEKKIREEDEQFAREEAHQRHS
jgi:hypothetical protein